MAKNIAVFGLGSMGFGIALSLIRAGHHVWGFDLSEKAKDKLLKAGGNIEKIDKIAVQIDAVILVVLNAEQCFSLLSDTSELHSYLPAETLIMNCVTLSPDQAKALATLSYAKHWHYLDAPISGGAGKAEKGKLSIMASGPEKAFTLAHHFIDDIAETVFKISNNIGAGSAMKSVNQLLAGVHIAAMAEAITFGVAQGIAPADCARVISQSAGTSWMFENRSAHIIANDYTPKSSLKIWPKDLGIVTDIAEQLDFNAPMTKMALQQFLTAAKSGLSEEDDSALAKYYAQENQLTLP